MNEQQRIEFKKQLEFEKARNKEGITKKDRRLSEAKVGKKLFEDFLKNEIRNRLGNSIPETNKNKLLNVNWDFYAKLE